MFFLVHGKAALVLPRFNATYAEIQEGEQFGHQDVGKYADTLDKLRKKNLVRRSTA